MSMAKEIIIWSTKTGTKIETILSGQIRCAEMLSDGRLLLAGENKKIEIYTTKFNVDSIN